MRSHIHPSTLHPNSKPWAQCSSIHSNLGLVSIISLCNNWVEKKSFLSVEVLSKHSYDNIQMPCQSISQLGLHKIESGNYSFIFHISNVLNNDKFNKFYEFKRTNHQQTICGKLMLQLNQWIFISRYWGDI
jgi:hypothetical protein